MPGSYVVEASSHPVGLAETLRVSEQALPGVLCGSILSVADLDVASLPVPSLWVEPL